MRAKTGNIKLIWIIAKKFTTKMNSGGGQFTKWAHLEINLQLFAVDFSVAKDLW